MVRSSEGLQSHGSLDDHAPMPDATFDEFVAGDVVFVGTTPNAQYINLISGNIEAGQCLNHAEHDGVVRPDTPIDECVVVVLQRPKVSWRRGRGQADSHHFFEPIELVVGVVRGLVDEDLAVLSLKGGDTKAVARFTELPFAQDIGQHFFQ